MLKLPFLTLIFFLISVNLTIGNETDKIDGKNILILFSQTSGTPAYHVILDGIRLKLTEEFKDLYNLHIEYLETEKYQKFSYPKEKFALYNQKYKNVKLDLLILVGPDILTIVKNNADSTLLNLPTVSIDHDFSLYGANSDLLLNRKTAVVGIKFNIGSSISAALNIFPKTTSVYFVSGVSKLDSLVMTISRLEAKKIEDKRKITFLTDISMDEVLRSVSKLPENTIVIVPSFQMDSRRVLYYTPESMRLISKAANAPVFTYSDMGFGEGVMGGYIASYRKVGLKTGETAVKILNGTDPNSIKINETDIYEYVFDWRALRRWKIENSNLIPKESNVLFEEITFFGKYKWIISLVILIVFFQTILIMALVKMNRRQKLMNRQLVETKYKINEIFHEDRISNTSQLTASLSHELNQPLTAILSTAQAGIRFIDSGKTTPELMKELLANIADNDKRAASILNSVRGLMKLEKREKEKVNLNSLINEVVDLYRSKALELQSKLNLQIPDKSVFIWADSIQIQQVILNLISNASQSLEKTNGRNKMISVTETIENENVIVSVRDNGMGIDESVKDKLFKPFVTSGRQGMGIGLTICRSIIEDHHGTIWADNFPGSGAEFSFNLKIIDYEQNNS